MDGPIADRDKISIESRKDIFDERVDEFLNPSSFRLHYQKHLVKWIQFHIPPGSSVVDIGCGVGDLLARLEPAHGLGIDFSEAMIDAAKKRHPHLEFELADAHSLNEKKKKFDYILLSNLVGDVIDIQRVLKQIQKLSHPRTRIIITHYNYFWGPLVKIAEKLKIKPKQSEQNWLEVEDLANLLELTGIDPVKYSRDFLLPIKVPFFSALFNDYIGHLPGISRLCVNELVVGRMSPPQKKRDYKVSVIVACKDEKGNIEEIFRTVPRMGSGTELIFVDGHSSDGTVEEIERCIASLSSLNPELENARVFTQPGKGKGEAVRLGFDEAVGDILMILDADITVRPEDLPKFYDALVEGKGEFINGSRLVYPMEDEAMRFLNMLGNHFFGWAFSWLLDQRLTDTLCGTKVLFKKDYEAIKAGREFFGDFDPFGDFDLLFGAAKLNLKIREIPIRYRNREYGEIKISRFRHGLLLLKMSALAFKRFKLYRQA